MQLGQPPLLARLEGRRGVLVAGAGGGFDVFSGLPLYLHLRSRGIAAHLASLSFAELASAQGRWLTPHLLEVTPDSGGAPYFPERALSRWLETRGDPGRIFCIDRVGCRPAAAAYRALVAELGVDAVVLVDGGTDILMRGDEAGLGTPEEDITSLAAVNGLEVEEKLVACLGFGVDRFHGVCHAQFLEAVAALSREGAFLGALSLLAGMPEVDGFREAVAFANRHMPRFPSIVANSVASAVEGEFGDVHRTARTAGSRLWINPLMSMYWAFDLGAVARRCLYLPEVERTDSLAQVASVVGRLRASLAPRAWDAIPL